MHLSPGIWAYFSLCKPSGRPALFSGGSVVGTNEKSLPPFVGIDQLPDPLYAVFDPLFRFPSFLTYAKKTALVEAVLAFIRPLSEKRADQQVRIQSDDDAGDNPGEQFHPERIREFAHLFLVARKLDQRNDRERKLQRQDNLAQDEQLRCAAFAGNGRDDDRRHDRDEPRDQSS